MKGIYVALATIAFAASVSALYDAECQADHEGIFVKHPKDCSQYIECDGKKFIRERQCWDDLLYLPGKYNISSNGRECQPPESVPCTNKPTQKVDPCPQFPGTVRLPYPGNRRKYILCIDGINLGYRRDARVNGEILKDQRYFNECPKRGKFKVKYIQHPRFFFLCVDGIHVKTKLKTSADKDVLDPKNLPNDADLPKEAYMDKIRADRKKGAKNDKNRPLKGRKRLAVPDGSGSPIQSSEEIKE